MRKVVLTAVLTCVVVALPVMAQFRFGGAMSGNDLLAIPDVQKALKLTDEQKKDITAATQKMQEVLKEEGFQGFAKAREARDKALTKVADKFTKEQKSRLLGIMIQQAEARTQPGIFKNEDVQKALKLTEKQLETVKTALTDLEKDAKEIMEDAKGGGNFREAFTKVQKINKETYDKLAKGLTETQKKAWKDLQGEKVEIKFGFGPGIGKGKGKKKKDDF